MNLVSCDTARIHSTFVCNLVEAGTWEVHELMEMGQCVTKFAEEQHVAKTDIAGSHSGGQLLTFTPD